MSATLQGVIDELKLGRISDEGIRDSIDSLVAVVTNHINVIEYQAERDRLAEEERRRERDDTRHDRLGLPPPDMPPIGGGPLDMLKSVFGGSFLGNFAVDFLKVFVSPLKYIVKIFKVGGPIALALGALYYLFNDIMDNPKFAGVIEKIKQTWKLKILPLFDKISATIASLFGSDEVTNTLEFVSWAWNNFTDWLSNTFKPLFQDAFLDMFSTIADMIGSTFEGLSMILDGDIKNGALTIGLGLVNGAISLFDTAVSFILELLGVDLGPEGSFVLLVTEKITSLIQWVKDGFSAISDFFFITIPLWFEDAKTFINEQFWATIDKMKLAVVTAVENLGINDAITNAIAAIENTYIKIIDGFKNMVDYISGIPQRVYDYILSIDPDWMKSDSNMMPIDPKVLGADAEVSNRLMEKAFDLPSENEGLDLTVKPVPSNSSNLLQNGFKFSGGGGSNTNLIVSQDNRSSTISNTSTNMLGFTAPINEYAPW